MWHRRIQVRCSGVSATAETAVAVTTTGAEVEKINFVMSCNGTGRIHGVNFVRGFLVSFHARTTIDNYIIKENFYNNANITKTNANRRNAQETSPYGHHQFKNVT